MNQNMDSEKNQQEKSLSCLLPSSLFLITLEIIQELLQHRQGPSRLRSGYHMSGTPHRQEMECSVSTVAHILRIVTTELVLSIAPHFPFHFVVDVVAPAVEPVHGALQSTDTVVIATVDGQS